jgi:uncharacterized C2H2 Zn-finger protein
MAQVHEKFVYLHIPKCGGHWVKGAMRAAGIKTVHHVTHHAHVGMIHVLDRPIIAVVRHPLAWYRSYWCYRIGAGASEGPWDPLEKGIAWHPTWVLDQCGCEDFNDFIDNILERRRGYLTYTYRLYTGIGPRRIDHVIRLMDCPRALCGVLDRLQVNYDRDLLKAHPHEHVSSPDAKARATFRRDQAEAIYDTERTIFDEYGYTIDEYPFVQST